MSWLPRISMGLTIAQLSERLRCAECGGPVRSVKSWRMEDVLGKPLEPEKCKFPGEEGTPPNCKCPQGTEFLGYKGCVKYTLESYCSSNNKPGDRLINSRETEAFADKCKNQYEGTAS